MDVDSPQGPPKLSREDQFQAYEIKREAMERQKAAERGEIPESFAWAERPRKVNEDHEMAMAEDGRIDPRLLAMGQRISSGGDGDHVFRDSRGMVVDENFFKNFFNENQDQPSTRRKKKSEPEFQQPKAQIGGKERDDLGPKSNVGTGGKASRRGDGNELETPSTGRSDDDVLQLDPVAVRRNKERKQVEMDARFEKEVAKLSDEGQAYVQRKKTELQDDPEKWATWLRTTGAAIFKKGYEKFKEYEYKKGSAATRAGRGRKKIYDEDSDNDA